MADKREEARDRMSISAGYSRMRKGVRVSKDASLTFSRAEASREEWDMFAVIADEIHSEFLMGGGETS